MKKMISAILSMTAFNQTISAQWPLVYQGQIPFLVCDPNAPDDQIGLIQLEPSRIQYLDDELPPLYQGVIGPEDHTLTFHKMMDFADQL